MRKKYYIALLAGLLTAACSQQDEPVVPGEEAVAIGFTASLGAATDDWAVTRAGMGQDAARPSQASLAGFGGRGIVATGECALFNGPAAVTRADTDLNDNRLKGLDWEGPSGFGVFAAYTGLHKYSESDVTSDFMYNDHVTWDSGTGKWGYSPLRYWPNGLGTSGVQANDLPHYVSFFGYAPYSFSGSEAADSGENAADYCIQSFHYASEHTNPWLIYRLHTDVTKQVDLLFAQKLDQTKPLGDNTPVQFGFRHALACVGDVVTLVPTDDVKAAIDMRGDGTKIRLTHVSVTFELTEKARLVLWSPTDGVANWQPVLSENFLTERTVTLLDKLDNPEEGTVIYTAPNGTVGNNVMQDKGVYYIPLEVGSTRQKATVHVTYDVVDSAGEVLLTQVGESSLLLSDPAYSEAYQPGKRLDIKVTLDNFR